MSVDGSVAPTFGLPGTAGGDVSFTDRLDGGPAVVLIDRWHRCSLRAVSADLRFGDGLSVLPVVTSPLARPVEASDRLDPRVRLLADPDGRVVSATAASGRRATARPARSTGRGPATSR